MESGIVRQYLQTLDKVTGSSFPRALRNRVHDILTASDLVGPPRCISEIDIQQLNEILEVCTGTDIPRELIQLPTTALEDNTSKLTQYGVWFENCVRRAHLQTTIPHFYLVKQHIPSVFHHLLGTNGLVTPSLYGLYAITKLISGAYLALNPSLTKAMCDLYEATWPEGMYFTGISPNYQPVVLSDIVLPCDPQGLFYG